MLANVNEKLLEVLSNFTQEFEALHESIFRSYCDDLELEGPVHGFLSEDCFTPSGPEECSYVVDLSWQGIVEIYEKITDDYQKFYNIIYGIFSQIFKKYGGLLDLKRHAKYLEKAKHDFKSEAAKLLEQIMLIYAQIIGKIFSELATADRDQRVPMLISYRDEGRGQGAFYDHYVMQKRTGHPTAIIKPTIMGVSDLVTAIRTNTWQLTYGDIRNNSLGKRVPPVLHFPPTEKSGLLVIPGRARATEKRYRVHNARTTFERQAIRDARLRGRPILGICAGSWAVWAGYGGTTIKVTDHVFSQMLRIVKSGNVGVNKQIHRVDVGENTLLAKAMNYGPQYTGGNFNIPVNSVHWLAPNGGNMPDNVQISATTRQDNNLAPNSRRGTQMQPTQGSVEAFETKFGAPTFGIQWHPEGYNYTDTGNCAIGHINLLIFMAEAGQAYAKKQGMLEEFKGRVPLIKCNGFFKKHLNKEEKNEEKDEFNFKME